MGHVRPQPGKYRPAKKEKIFTGITARDLSKHPEFIKACEKLGVTPSIRKARDYRNKMGKFSVYK